MEKLKNGFCTNDVLSLGDDGENDTNSSFGDNNELAKFIDNTLDICDDHPSIYYTSKIHRFFRKFKRVNRSEHGRGANEFVNILEYEGVNCYIPSGSGCFLERINYIYRNEFTTEYFEIIQSYKRRTNVTRWCRIPECCERNIK